MSEHVRDVRPFTDAEYALLVLQGLKRMIRHTDWYQRYVPPRSYMQDAAEGRQVADMLDFACEAIREQVERRQTVEEPRDAVKAYEEPKTYREALRGEKWR